MSEKTIAMVNPKWMEKSEVEKEVHQRSMTSAFRLLLSHSRKKMCTVDYIVCANDANFVTETIEMCF